MGKIAIVTDTSCDLPQDYFAEHNIRRVSMHIHFGEEELVDQKTISHEQFYDRMAGEMEVLPRTTQPQAKDFVEVYENLKEEGYDTVLSLHISHKMSGTVQAARLASEMVTDMDIIPIDTAQVGPPLGVFVYAVVEKMKKESDKDKLVEFTQKLIDEQPIFEAFSVETMDYLVKNGRVGRAKGFVAGFLNIKPILTVSNGEIAPLDKVRGTKTLYKKMADLAVEKMSSAESPLLLLSWGGIPQEKSIATVENLIKEQMDREYTSLRARLAPTIACHSGPETISITTFDAGLI